MPVHILLQGAFLRKADMLKKVRFELGKFLELHGEGKRSGPTAGGEMRQVLTNMKQQSVEKF